MRRLVIDYTRRCACSTVNHAYSPQEHARERERVCVFLIPGCTDEVAPNGWALHSMTLWTQCCSAPISVRLNRLYVLGDNNNNNNVINYSKKNIVLIVYYSSRCYTAILISCGISPGNQQTFSKYCNLDISSVSFLKGYFDDDIIPVLTWHISTSLSSRPGDCLITLGWHRSRSRSQIQLCMKTKFRVRTSQSWPTPVLAKIWNWNFESF